jgi:hypothetical protein
MNPHFATIEIQVADLEDPPIVSLREINKEKNNFVKKSDKKNES